MADAGIACFGPSAAAARIESSKAFAKTVMQTAGVPTARAMVCDTLAAAHAAIAESEGRVVIKADGLAAGKGVTVCGSVAEAHDAVKDCLVGASFGRPAGGSWSRSCWKATSCRSWRSATASTSSR